MNRVYSVNGGHKRGKLHERDISREASYSLKQKLNFLNEARENTLTLSQRLVFTKFDFDMNLFLSLWFLPQ